MRFPFMILLLLTSACGELAGEGTASERRSEPPNPAPTERTSSPLTSAKQPESAEPSPALLIGEKIARDQWAGADNKRACAPLALAADGGKGGVARPARFSGGWAVAFDLPEIRSAYGLAGPALLALDDAPAVGQRHRLERQWPYFTALPHLPEPSFAGYGLAGANPYPDDYPSGVGMESIAYVRLAGQTCTYNVWSRLGRAHLETLLANLRLLRP
jgi:hypothetical protein